MKIITWNCNMVFRKKADIILAQKPDILIVPECEHPDKLIFKNDTLKPTDVLWFGQNKNKGERLGQIDVLGAFKVRVDVDEHYLSRIYTGLKGHFDFADSTYELVIKKVYSQITNGRFQVDMEFTGKVPKGIRRGQTLQILLALSDERQAILLPKGGFYQQTGGNWIFKVNKDGNAAYKVNIQLGNQNPDYYEVLDGLQPGDKVVTSSYENYGNMEQLVLNKQ